jgi:hypothetical protein
MLSLLSAQSLGLTFWCEEELFTTLTSKQQEELFWTPLKWDLAANKNYFQQKQGNCLKTPMVIIAKQKELDIKKYKLMYYYVQQELALFSSLVQSGPQNSSQGEAWLVHNWD